MLDPWPTPTSSTASFDVSFPTVTTKIQAISSISKTFKINNKNNNTFLTATNNQNNDYSAR